MKEALIRILRVIIICIGVFMYSFYSYVLKEFTALFWAPCLLGLVEFICAIVYKKAVFLLSIIQAVVFAFTLSFTIYLFEEYILDQTIFWGYVLIPGVACALLLIGGIMFRKEKAISGGTN